MYRKMLHQTALIRLWLNKNSQRLLLGPVSGKIPDSFINSVEESSCEKEVQPHFCSVHKIHGARIVEYPLPEDFPAWFRREKAFDAKKIYMLRNVVVSPSSGLIWSERGVLFGESIGELFRLLGWGACLHEPLIPHKTVHIDSPVVCCPAALYYHWLLEILPNILHTSDLFPDVKIIVSKKCSPFIMEGLELAIGEEACKQKILLSHDKVPLRVSQAVMPALEKWSGFVRPEDVARIRKAFEPHRDRNPAPSEQTQLYISRAHAYRRRLPHENGIEELLQNAGFKIIYPEEMSLKDQIKVFSQANTIVAPHGAGLSNMIWRTGDCHIVEIFTPEWLNDCYARLAVQLGFNYNYVSAHDGTEASETVRRILTALAKDNRHGSDASSSG
jgi:hypothetical protein